nr:MAG TPA: hypothetical protein [Caudoviricetes sp.]
MLLLRLLGGLFVSLDASLNGGLKCLLVRVGGGQLLTVTASKLTHLPGLLVGNLRVLLPEHSHAYSSQIGGVVLLSNFVQFIEHFGVHVSISFVVKNMLLFLHLLDSLVDTSCRQTGHNAHSNGGQRVRGREILEAGIQRRHAQNAPTQAHDSRDVLVIQTGRFDNQSHQITDDGNGRHGRNSKVHKITSHPVDFCRKNDIVDMSFGTRCPGSILSSFF